MNMKKRQNWDLNHKYQREVQTNSYEKNTWLVQWNEYISQGSWKELGYQNWVRVEA